MIRMGMHKHSIVDTANALSEIFKGGDIVGRMVAMNLLFS